MPKSPQDDLTPVVDFLAASQENLAIATAVHAQYPAARQQILIEFFAKLKARLMNGRSNWWALYDPPFFTERWGAFIISKESWNGEYQIRLEAYDRGDKIIGGVWRYATQIKEMLHYAPILEAFNNASENAKRGTWYEAEVEITSPAADWRTPEALWTLKTRPEFLDKVEAMFLKWIKIAEPLLDECVVQK